MPRAKATDSLSVEGQRVMNAGFVSRTPSAIIANQIAAATGEMVAERTIARRKSEWEAEQRRRQLGREQMEDLLTAQRQGSATASEMVNALAMEALLRDPDGFSVLNPIDVQRTSIQAEKVRLQRDQLELKRRQMVLDEEKFALLKKQKERAMEVLEGPASKVLTAEERIQKVREAYGLNA